jgi:rhodanese-related sulfurtransferase
MYAAARAEAFADVDEIEVEELEDLEEREAVLFVDCREDREREVSVIAGSLSMAEFEAVAADSRDRLIVTYCTIGHRSGVYAETLAERGFRARNLVGGVLAWAHAGRSFVDEDGNPVRRVHVYGAEWDLLPESYEGVHEGKPAP